MVLASVIGGAVACALVSGAHALWSVNGVEATSSMLVGDVSFAANPEADTTQATYSSAGEAVDVTLPGTALITVLDQTGIAPDPVIWRFQARGFGQGITGIDFDVAVTSQVATDGTVIDISDGFAGENTLLSFSTIKVYPAAAGGDCSAVPDTPEDADGENVHVYDGDAHELQAAGAYADGETVQDWCVAMNYNLDPDGTYLNTVSATGAGEDGSELTALTEWTSAIGFPPSLNALGEYVNSAESTGTGQDGTETSGSSLWSSVIYPDPSNEPDIVISLDPAVTNVNPDVETGDTFVKN